MDLRETVEKFWSFATADQQARHDNISRCSAASDGFWDLAIVHIEP